MTHFSPLNTGFKSTTCAAKNSFRRTHSVTTPFGIHDKNFIENQKLNSETFNTNDIANKHQVKNPCEKQAGIPKRYNKTTKTGGNFWKFRSDDQKHQTHEGNYPLTSMGDTRHKFWVNMNLSENRRMLFNTQGSFFSNHCNSETRLHSIQLDKKSDRVMNDDTRREKADQAEICHVEDWMNHKQTAAGDDLKKTTKFQIKKSFGTDRKIGKSSTRIDNDSADGDDRTPVINTDMVDSILRGKEPEVDVDPDQVGKGPRKQRNDIYISSRMNEELLAEQIKTKLKKNILEDGDKTNKVLEIRPQQVKMIASEYTSKFSTQHSMQTINFSSFYNQIESDLDGFIKNLGKKKRGQSTSDEDNPKLVRNKIIREILSEFGIRLDIYKMYCSKKTKYIQMHDEVRKLTHEKVEIQSATKKLIEQMTLNTGINVSQAFRVKRAMSIYLLSKDGMGGGTQGQKELSQMPHALKADKDNAQLKIQWADRLEERQNMAKAKDYAVSEFLGKIKIAKDEKKNLKQRLKDLYFNLLNEPQVICEKGLMIEDIVTFLKILGIFVTKPNLYEKFIDEEKEFILKMSDLKLRWLQVSNKMDDWALNFSDNRKKCRKNAMTINQNSAMNNDNARENLVLEDFETILKKTIEVAEDKIDQKQTCMRKQNIKISKPIETYDYKNRIMVTKWVQEPNSYAQKLEEIDQMDYKPHIQHTETKTIEKRGDVKSHVEEIIILQKELKKEFMESIRKKMQEMHSTQLGENINGLKQRVGLVFGFGESGSDYKNMLSDLHKEKVLDKAHGLEGDDKRKDIMSKHSQTVVKNKQLERGIDSQGGSDKTENLFKRMSNILTNRSNVKGLQKRSSRVFAK